MAKEPQVREIQGKQFEFYPLSPKEALKVVTRLSKIIAEPFGLVMDAAGQEAKGKGGDGLIQTFLSGQLGADVLSKAMRALTDRLDEKEVEETCYMLLSKVHGQFEGDAGPRRMNIDLDFAGDFGLFMEVVGYSIEVNFGDFLRGKLGGVVTRSRTVTPLAAT